MDVKYMNVTTPPCVWGCAGFGCGGEGVAHGHNQCGVDTSLSSMSMGLSVRTFIHHRSVRPFCHNHPSSYLQTSFNSSIHPLIHSSIIYPLSINLPIHSSVRSSVHPSMHSSIHPSIHLSIQLLIQNSLIRPTSIYPLTHSSIHPLIYGYIHKEHIAVSPQATFKRYQTEHKVKQDSLERSQTDLKKLRRKSQGKNSSKYDIKENEVGHGGKTSKTSPALTPRGALEHICYGQLGLSRFSYSIAAVCWGKERSCT